MVDASQPRLAILAGGGSLPLEVAYAAQASGHPVLVVGIAEEADLAGLGPDIETAKVGWGQVGTLMRTLTDFGTQKLVIIGSISKRPDYKSLKLDWGAVQMLPRILNTVLSGGDTTVLDKVATLFSEKGFDLVGAHEVAPSLVAAKGHLGGPKPSDTMLEDAKLAACAAWTAGHLDMGQGAVAASGRLIAMEGAEGTDGLLERVESMRANKRFSTKGRCGALAKCARPAQDLRLDMPTIGPRTIENAAKAGLSMVVAEAGSVLISEHDKTFALCKREDVALVGEPRSAFLPDGHADKLAP